MSLDLHIRKATHADIPVMQALIEESVRGLNPQHYSQTQIESALIHIYGVDTQLIDDGTYFAVEAGGRIVACGGWSRRKNLIGGDQMKAGEDSLLDPQTEPARIRAFFVHPDFARRGIGRLMIETCEQAARESGFLRLELMATLTGQPLYAVCGFVALEPFDIPMPDNLSFPVIRMSKQIAA